MKTGITSSNQITKNKHKQIPHIHSHKKSNYHKQSISQTNMNNWINLLLGRYCIIDLRRIRLIGRYWRSGVVVGDKGKKEEKGRGRRGRRLLRNFCRSLRISVRDWNLGIMCESIGVCDQFLRILCNNVLVYIFERYLI